MSSIRDLRAMLRSATGPTLITLIAAYFAYHVVQGDHGLISYHKLRNQVAAAEVVAAGLAAERASLQRRTRLLRGDQLDRDLLDETVRQRLHLARPDEIVIILD